MKHIFSIPLFVILNTALDFMFFYYKYKIRHCKVNRIIDIALLIIRISLSFVYVFTISLKITEVVDLYIMLIIIFLTISSFKEIQVEFDISYM
jgi:hypothetical protein